MIINSVVIINSVLLIISLVIIKTVVIISSAVIINSVKIINLLLINNYVVIIKYVMINYSALIIRYVVIINHVVIINSCVINKAVVISTTALIISSDYYYGLGLSKHTHHAYTDRSQERKKWQYCVINKFIRVKISVFHVVFVELCITLFWLQLTTSCRFCFVNNKFTFNYISISW